MSAGDIGGQGRIGVGKVGVSAGCGGVVDRALQGDGGVGVNPVFGDAGDHGIIILRTPPRKSPHLYCWIAI